MLKHTKAGTHDQTANLAKVAGVSVLCSPFCVFSNMCGPHMPHAASSSHVCAANVWLCLCIASQRLSQARCCAHSIRKETLCITASKGGSLAREKNHLCHSTCDCVMQLALPLCTHLLPTLPHPPIPHKPPISILTIFPHYFQMYSTFSASTAVL